MKNSSESGPSRRSLSGPPWITSIVITSYSIHYTKLYDLVIFGTIALYYGLNKGKASVVVPLSSIGPAITAILAVIFLKEQLTYPQIAGIVLILSGVIVLSINS